MTEPHIPVTEDELHAYVDGELPAERTPAVEAWLATHPEDAERVEAWRAMGQALHARYGGVLDEGVPKRLELDRLVKAPRRWIYGAVAAALLAFVIGGGVGWSVRSVSASPADPLELLRREAITAHKLYIGEVRHPIEVAATEAHLLPWLSRRVGTTLRAPDLASFDLKLLGGRLLPGITAPAALFMYENPAGERVTLYATPLKTATSGLIYKEDNRVALVEWVSDNYGFAISGPADKPRLKGIARASYEQMEKR